MRITVYGASDDLIELESLDEFGALDGKWGAEFNVSSDGGPFYLAFSSGTLLRVSYDGFWHIVALEKGSCKIDHRSATDIDDDYSDVVELECVDGFSWVICSEQMERLSGQLDIFES